MNKQGNRFINNNQMDVYNNQNSQVNEDMYSNYSHNPEEDNPPKKKNKIIIILAIILFLILLGVLLFFLLRKDNSQPKISLSSNEMTLEVETQDVLAVNVQNVSEQISFNYQSADENIATVDESGIVTGVGVGQTIVTVSYKYNEKTYSLTCNVTVTAKGSGGGNSGGKMVAVTEISLDKTSLTMNINGTAKLTAIIKPDNATNKTVTWTSSNNTIATVSNGMITAKAQGNVTIIARSSNGKVAQCNVQVNKPITIVDISKATISTIANQTYTGSAIKPTVTVTYNGTTLKNGTDYTVTYSNNTNMGTATVTITGMNNYKGTKQATFKIVGASINNVTISGLSDKTYTGSAITQAPTVKVGTTTLKNNTDYTYKITNNTNVGTATVTVTGTGNYAGTKTATFKITAANMSGTTVSGLSNKTYTGSAITQTPTVKFGTITLKNGTDYTYTTKNNTNVGTATITITGKGNFTGTKTATFKITAANMSGATVTVSKATVDYTGKAITQAPTVKYNGTTLKNGTDYTYTTTNNTKVGTATVTVTGKGNFTGTKKVTFKICNWTKTATSTNVTSCSATSKPSSPKENNTYVTCSTTKTLYRYTTKSFTCQYQKTVEPDLEYSCLTQTTPQQTVKCTSCGSGYNLYNGKCYRCPNGFSSFSNGKCSNKKTSSVAAYVSGFSYTSVSAAKTAGVNYVKNKCNNSKPSGYTLTNSSSITAANVISTTGMRRYYTKATYTYKCS